MKTRRHHNNKGTRQIKRGKTREQVAEIAKRLKLPTKCPDYFTCDRHDETCKQCKEMEEEPGYGFGV